MTATWALFRKNVADARWMLLTLCSALFGLSWLFVFATHRNEVRLKQAIGSGGGGAARMLRGMGGPAMDFSTGAIEMTFWNTPVILLIVAIWGIARGSAGVAGEVERGTMDMILSRPITRAAYLAAQALAAAFGLVALDAALLAGNQVGAHYNSLATPPTLLMLARPLLNLAAFGFAIYGYTLLCSTLDLVRWRPNLIGSVATLAGYVALIVANLPALGDDYKWLEHLSIFKAFDPVEVITKGENFAFNTGILLLVGSIGLSLGFVAFLRRDLPAGS